jgi:probable phosphoglycerate mutase
MAASTNGSTTSNDGAIATPDGAAATDSVESRDVESRDGAAATDGVESSDGGAAATDSPVAADAASDQRPEPEGRPVVVTVVLVRHGRSTANTAGILAGRTPGVNLDDNGQSQAAAIAERLAGNKFDRLVSSPMDRCLQTVTPFSEAVGLPVEVDDRFAEVDYGQWSGRKLSELGGEPLWRTVQQHPSAAVFPGGEGLAEVSARAAAAIRDIRLAAAKDQTVLVCSHGDVIKAILADALGMHLDAFQRIVVAPASISVVRYTPLRPFVERINDTGDLGSISPHPKPKEPADDAESTSDAVPGGVVR